MIRNTYLLLSLTLAFAAGVASPSAVLKLPHPGILLTLGCFLGLLFVVHRFKNSGWGIFAVVALTGFMGYTLGPIINRYLGLPNVRLSCRRWGSPPRFSLASRPMR